MLIEFKIYTLIFFNNNVRNDRTTTVLQKKGKSTAIYNSQKKSSTKSRVRTI